MPLLSLASAADAANVGAFIRRPSSIATTAPMPGDKLTATLPSWADYKDSVSWQSLLLGNGASRAVWDGFSYHSLYDVATALPAAERLSAEDVALFAALGGTRNFEGVLGSLLTARAIAGALDLQPAKRITDRYASIQRGLVAAVHRVHVPWTALEPDTLRTVREALLEYETVFSTNYDLLVYWAMMSDRPSDFRDFFWGGAFNSSDTKVWGKATRILYLHGALHLYYDSSGATRKERAEGYVNLLDLFGKNPDAVPLCITEGTSAQKMAAISRSDYLSFGYHQFGSHVGPMVVIGQSLSDTDAHLVEAMARERGRTVAVGIYPGADAEIIKAKAHFWGILPTANVLFFDSRTHPLGSATLKVG